MKIEIEWKWKLTKNEKLNEKWMKIDREITSQK